MALGMAFQLSDDIMDVISTEAELHKLPGQDMKQGLYTLPVLYALEDGSVAGELRALLDGGLGDDEAFARALDLVRSEGPIGRAREAVTSQVRRSNRLAEGLAQGRARDALLHIAGFLAARCGAEI